MAASIAGARGPRGRRGLMAAPLLWAVAAHHPPGARQARRSDQRDVITRLTTGSLCEYMVHER